MMLRSIAICLLILMPDAHAEDETAAHYEQVGRKAFDAKKFREALQAFRTAFQLDPAPVRASTVAMVSPYAEPLSAAIADLNTWLVLKRRDAKKVGDKEDSWNNLESVINALTAHAKRIEQITIKETTEVQRLREQVTILNSKIGKLQDELTNAKLKLDTDRFRPDRDR
jgi:hypothetical protein